ncbi:MAG: hypothetical protein ABR499_13635 [Gemmatimonadaceae bacterium]
MRLEFGGSTREGKRMRRTIAILTVCLCVTGCRGGAAQAPYDGMIAAAQRPANAAAAHALQAVEATPIASEVDVPWTIALLTDEPAPVIRRPRRVAVVDRGPETAEPLSREDEGEIRIVAEHGHADEKPTTDEKPATPKACNGVVKSRS